MAVKPTTKDCTNGPFTTEVSILFINDGGDEARVKYVLPRGKLPTKEGIARGIAEAAKAIPPGFRLANRHEFMAAELGVSLERMAMPGPKEFPEPV